MKVTTMQNGLTLITIITITLTVFCVPVLGKHGKHRNQRARMELVHRHDSRMGEARVDRTDAVRGFVHRDSLRYQRMKTKMSSRSTSRRRDQETVPLPHMQMLSGSDYGIGEYFAEVKIGTPRQRFWLAADTGSEFTWFNCLLVHKRNNKRVRLHSKKHKGGSRLRNKSRSAKNKTNPCSGVFCPHRSRSFETVACSSTKCKVDLSEMFSLSYCPKPHAPCLYDISYADGSSAKGFFGTDIITVDLTNGKRGKLQNLTIGCTRSMHNGVTFNEKTGGILGLGYARDSLVDKAAVKYGGKFSYCLVDHLSHTNVSSYLTFGGHDNVTLLSEMKKTELVMVAPFYGVNIVGISAGGQMLKIPPQVWDFNTQGGTIVDSGTTLTSLVESAYQPVYETLTKALTNVNRIKLDVLDFCFKTEGFDEKVVPRLVFHFAGGTKFEPPIKSYIIDVAPQVKCIGLNPLPDGGASVIGNIMQQNHLWEFDLAHNTIGFAPSTCT